jgi:hypothetical protein
VLKGYGRGVRWHWVTPLTDSLWTLVEECAEEHSLMRYLGSCLSCLQQSGRVNAE